MVHVREHAPCWQIYSSENIQRTLSQVQDIVPPYINLISFTYKLFECEQLTKWDGLTF